jgi:hypothetical protein
VGAGWVLVVLFLGISVGAAAAVWFWFPKVPSDLESDVVTAVPAAVELYDGRRAGSISLGLEAGRTLTSPTDGVVTASHCAPGAALESGDSLVAIDGEAIVALTTEVPLWRELNRGMRGADVTALQLELQRLGFQLEATGVFDTDTQTAVRSFNQGLGRNDQSGVTPQNVLWLPSASWEVGTCVVGLGDRVTVSSTLAIAPPAVARFHLEGDLPEALLDMRWMFQTAGQTIMLDRQLQPANAADMQTLEGLLSSSEATTPTVRFDGEIALVEPIEVVVVPPASVQVGADGSRACIRLADTLETVAATVIDSSLGRTVLIPSSSVPAGTLIALARPNRC